MNNTPVIYEFPLNERIRIFMRLELLFQQLAYFMQEGGSVWDRRAAVDTLLDIMAIFSRNDIKSEVLKELDRHGNILGHMAHDQDADKGALLATLDEMNGIGKALYASAGKTGLEVLKNDFLQSIAQRNSIPGGSCSFDLPVFHCWLEHQGLGCGWTLEQWVRPFSALRRAIDIILGSIRNSADVRDEVATAGFFQLALESSHSYQLLRVAIDRNQPCYAEISGGKHRFSIRFMAPHAEMGRPRQCAGNVNFKLSCCIF